MARVILGNFSRGSIISFVQLIFFSGGGGVGGRDFPPPVISEPLLKPN